MYVRVGLIVFKYWKEILVGFLSIFVIIFVCILTVMPSGSGDTPQQGAMPTNGQGGKAVVPNEVRQYEPVLRGYLKEKNLESYTEILLGLTMQESGGKLVDIMQSSESIGLAPNAISDTDTSIRVGVEHFSKMLKLAQSKGITDIQVVLQGYNMGPGFILFAAENGGKWTEDLAKQFALKHAKRSSCGFRSPYCYGDFTYVPKILKNFQGSDSVSPVLGGDMFNTVMSEMLKYEGFPYSWGGADPSTSFDCSGLMMWSFRKANINLPRTAGEQYAATTRVQESELQPGDLVFFSGTSDHALISHVGIYVGNGKMYNSNSKGIKYDDLTQGYWKSKIYGFGRVKQA